MSILSNKASLIKFITDRIRYNKNFETTSEKIKQSFINVIDTLWDKIETTVVVYDPNEPILEIDESISGPIIVTCDADIAADVEVSFSVTANNARVVPDSLETFTSWEQPSLSGTPIQASLPVTSPVDVVTNGYQFNNETNAYIILSIESSSGKKIYAKKNVYARRKFYYGPSETPVSNILSARALNGNKYTSQSEDVANSNHSIDGARGYFDLPINTTNLNYYFLLPPGWTVDTIQDLSTNEGLKSEYVNVATFTLNGNWNLYRLTLDVPYETTTTHRITAVKFI